VETLKIKNYIIILLIVLTLVSYTQAEEKMKIIPYGTTEFKEFVKNAPISLDEAWNLQLKYYEDKKEDKVGSPLFFIIDEYYVFSPYRNNKIPEVRLEGIWVDSKTGETKYIQNNIKLKPKSQFGWSK